MASKRKEPSNDVIVQFDNRWSRMSFDADYLLGAMPSDPIMLRFIDDVRALKAQLADQKPESLIGLWAHLLGDEGEITRQVKIIRQGPPGTWIVQYYSFLDGDETDMGVVREEVLIDPEKCVLYPTNEHMNHAYEHGSLGHHSRRVFDARHKEKGGKI